MCWNAEVSLLSAVTGYICTVFLIMVGRRAEVDPRSTRWNKAAKWHALFVGNIASVELCEFIIWLNVLPLSHASISQDECPLINRIGTYGVFLFGFVNWMWLVAVWAYMSSNGGHDKEKFKMWVVLGVITSLAYLAKIIMGDRYQLGLTYWHDARWEYNPDIPVVTCSFQETGRYPHLHWRFNMSQQAWLPAGYAWFVVGLMPLFFYKPWGMAAATFTWGALTYVIPIILLPPEETMSVY